MLTRRALLRGVGMAALIVAMGGSRLSSIEMASAAGSPRPDQRDPKVSDDSTQGNIVSRCWLNATTGRFWQATDVTAGAAIWSDQGIPSRHPGDTGTWAALLGTKPLTSAYASGIKPFVDVYAVDRSIMDGSTNDRNAMDKSRGGFTGPYTINFVDGAIDTGRIRALQKANPATAGLPEDKMCVQRILLVARWYDQSGNSRHFNQPFGACMPTLWLIDGTADGTGEDSVRIAFSRNPPLLGLAPSDRHIAFTGAGFSTQSTTVYTVCQPHEASNDTATWASVFDTSVDINGIQVATPGIDWVTHADPDRDSMAKWRVTNRDAYINTSGTSFSTSPTVISVALGASGVELATNDDILILPALPKGNGSGFVIGANHESWNLGSPEQAGSPLKGFYGTIDAVLVRATTDDANTTKGVRFSLMGAFDVVPQVANDTVVIEGDSGTVSWGGVFPLVPYTDSSGDFHLADMGINGYGLNWMAQRKTSRLVRFVQFGRGGTGWLDPSTDTGLNSFFNRLPALKAQYNPRAKRNICVANSHGYGLNDGIAGSVHDDAIATYNFMVSWLDALRAGGQNWTVVLGLMWGGRPGGGFQAFNQMVIDNAASLNISYFTELTTAQSTPVAGAPHQLARLYLWSEMFGRYGGHGSPLLYAIQSTAWAKAISAVL